MIYNWVVTAAYQGRRKWHISIVIQPLRSRTGSGHWAAKARKWTPYFISIILGMEKPQIIWLSLILLTWGDWILQCSCGSNSCRPSRRQEVEVRMGGGAVTLRHGVQGEQKSNTCRVNIQKKAETRRTGTRRENWLTQMNITQMYYWEDVRNERTREENGRKK